MIEESAHALNGYEQCLSSSTDIKKIKRIFKKQVVLLSKSSIPKKLYLIPPKDQHLSEKIPIEGKTSWKG